MRRPEEPAHSFPAEAFDLVPDDVSAPFEPFSRSPDRDSGRDSGRDSAVDVEVVVERSPESEFEFEDEDEDEDEDDALPPVVSDPLVAPAGVAASPSPAALRWLLLRRSTLAQPLPLKTTAGAVIALRICPPHSGHTREASSCTPWRISARWPQFEHR